MKIIKVYETMVLENIAYLSHIYILFLTCVYNRYNILIKQNNRTNVFMNPTHQNSVTHVR